MPLLQSHAIKWHHSQRWSVIKKGLMTNHRQSISFSSLCGVATNCLRNDKLLTHIGRINFTEQYPKQNNNYVMFLWLPLASACRISLINIYTSRQSRGLRVLSRLFSMCIFAFTTTGRKIRIRFAIIKMRLLCECAVFLWKRHYHVWWQLCNAWIDVEIIAKVLDANINRNWVYIYVVVNRDGHDMGVIKWKCVTNYVDIIRSQHGM